ncbi:hypothetical protein HRbin36_01027 [bacterium HR36]|nr:hypothetical protein HRbin36_01027 [bacterium HR36]
MSGQWQKAICAWLMLLGAGSLGTPAVIAAVRVVNVQVGFQDEKTGVSYGRYGHWLPVRVTVAADRAESIAGRVVVSISDADGIVQEVMAEPALHLTPEVREQTVWAYVQCSHGKLRVRVVDQAKRALASFVYPDDTGQPRLWQLLPPSVVQVLALGEPAGLDGATAEQEAGRDPGYRVSRIAGPQHLPEKWFGYDYVQALVLATGGEIGQKWLEAIQRRPSLAQAWRQWVQQGGHLVICAGMHAERVSQMAQFPLADLLPGEWLAGRQPYAELLIGVREVTAARYREPTALSALRAPWAEFRKRPTASQRAFAAEPFKPAVLVWPYGLGQVSLVAFDTNVGAFTHWDGRTAFWEWLLETKPLPGRQTYRTALTSQREREPLTQLVHELEQFQTEEIPFASVAGLMLAYVLLAGPFDYFLWVRWLRRPVLAWLTFPLVVVLVTIAAWYSAWAIHGSEVTVHELVLYDLELTADSRGPTRLTRGSGSCWLVLKSPRLMGYSLEVAEGQAATTADGQTCAVLESVLGWTIRPDDDALQRGQQESLVQGAVQVFPGRGRLENVPLQAWSMKTLFARWLLTWESPPLLCESRLTAPDLNTVRGELVWRAPWPLLDCELNFGTRVWPLGDLLPHHKVTIQRNDVGLLERQRFSHRHTHHSIAASASSAVDNGSSSEAQNQSYRLAETLRQLTFQRLLVAGRREAPSPYLPFLDQSGRLRYNQAVITGYLPVSEIPLSQLRQDASLSRTLVQLEPALPGKLKRFVFVRLYLPLSTPD